MVWGGAKTEAAGWSVGGAEGGEQGEGESFLGEFFLSSFLLYFL